MPGNTIKKHINERLKTEDGTSTVLLKSRKYRKDNKSGFRGVNKTADNKFRVFIGFKGKKYSLGTYENFTDAINKRCEAEQLLFEGYIQAKEHWYKKEPLIFDAIKDGNILSIHSNDPSMDGKYILCCFENPSDHKTLFDYHKSTIRRRIYNHHSFHH